MFCFWSRRVVRPPAVAPGRRGRLVVGAVDVLLPTPVRGVVGLHGVDVARGLGHLCGALPTLEFSRTPGPRRRLASFVRFETYQTVSAGASGLSRTSPVARFTTLPIEQPVFHGEGAQSQVVQEPFQIRHTPPR